MSPVLFSGILGDCSNLGGSWQSTVENEKDIFKLIQVFLRSQQDSEFFHIKIGSIRL